MRYGARTFEAMATLLPPLLLTGGPAAGKTVTARFLAETTPRTGYLDVDDIRQLVKNGGAAPWDGTEGKAQQVLGVRNAAALARNFAGAGFNVTITDVIDTVTPRSTGGPLPDVFVVRLAISLDAAWGRARTRDVHLTDAEFDMLHARQLAALEVDEELDVTHLDRARQAQSVEPLWTRRLR